VSAAPSSAFTVRTGFGSWPLLAGEEILVGRAEDAQVRVESPTVSRRHVSLRHTGDACRVTDLASRAGTWVDGEQVVSATSLRPPFTVHLGAADGLAVSVLEAATTGPVATTRPAPASVAVDAAGTSVVLGRDPTCDVVLEDLLVSRAHARVVRGPGGWTVEDLGSRNGTFVDGARVERAELRPTSELTVGRTSFRIRGGMLQPHTDEGDISFAARGLGFTLPDGTVLLQGVSFALPGSSLVAVVGGSGAGKSTLMAALTGAQPATEGEVLYDGRDLYEHLASLRHRIGVVPQEDVVHAQLSARQALLYAAELRFPDDLDPAARSVRVEEVIAELGLTDHADTRVSALSGGQRKRVSVALELLTEPSLVFLDEPTSGLDAHLVEEVMLTLRRLADGGRTVVVITHDTEVLDLCDKVLVLAKGGRVAYFGTPDGVLPHFGAEGYATVIRRATDEPDIVVAEYRASAVHREQVDTPLRSLDRGRPMVAPPAEARQQSRRHQLSTLVRRQARVLVSDRTQAAFLALMPLVVAVLALVVPGEQGLGPPADGPVATGQPTQMLVILVLGAVFMGVAGTIGALVEERAIYVRERAVGLDPTAYLVSKVVIAGALLLVQVSLAVSVTLLVRPGPDRAVMLGLGAVELVLALWLCALASAALGLLLSALVRTTAQMMPVLVVTVMVQLVLSAGLFPVVGRAPLEQVAWLSPSRWGYAAAAGTVDVAALVPTAAEDGLWEANPLTWSACLLALVVLGALYAGAARWRLGRPYQLR
jgi:ABC transport system ATP-binding/permease protein